MSSTVTRSGNSPGIARLDLAPALAQLRLDVREAEQLVDARLLREAMDLLALDLGDAVLADRVAALERPLAELDVVLGGAREVLKQVAEGLLRADPKIDLETGVGEHAGGGIAAAPRLGGEAVRRQRLDQAAPRRRSSRSGRGPCRSRSSAGRIRRSRSGSPRRGASRSERISSATGSTFERRRRSPIPSSVTPSREERMLSSFFGPRPRIPLIRPCSAASLSWVRFSTPSSS